MSNLLNFIIGLLLLLIFVFAWSFSLYINQSSSSKPIIPSNSLVKESSKVKLFENYSSQTLKVAILNGCGVSGLGNAYGDILTNKYGLQVTRIENADNFDYSMTTLIILSKDNPNIENLLTILGTNINDGNVEFDARNNPEEDIQIIIGKDYQEFLNLNK